MIYTWTGDVKLFVPGVGTIPPHSTFEMRKDSLKLAGVIHLLKTKEMRKGGASRAPTLQQPSPEPDGLGVDASETDELDMGTSEIDEPDPAVDREGG